jgi:hypothetical protein
MISEESIIYKSGDLLESVVDHEAVILGMESGKYIGLNEIGTEIWSRLEHPVKVTELIMALTELYDEDHGIISEQVLEFLNSLQEKSLIRVLDED